MEVNGFIYAIIDGTNDFEYIGQTTKTVEERFNQHAQAKSRIGRAIRAHGEDLFVVAVLKVCHSKDELDFWERHFIKSRNSKHPNGYNLTDGGDGVVGLKHTPEHNAKIGAAQKGIPKRPETRKKLSDAHKGKPLPPEHRQKISEAERGEKNPFFGKKHTKAAKSKMADVHRKNNPYKNLLAELKAHQLLYTDLARLLGISQSSFTAKMLGQRNFTERDKVKFVEIFKKPIEELLARDDGKVSTSNRGISPYKNLLNEMYARHMSQGELGKLMGLSPASISVKMRGKKPFTERDKKKLVEIFFDKSIKYLLARDD